ncbi:MAG: hypothetical protein ABI072_10440 [Edaphobacter sp.]
MFLGALVVSAGTARATPISFPTLQSPAAGSTTDGCSGCLFSYAAVPAGAVGDALTSWSFYALNSNPVTPVIFDSNGYVSAIGTTFTPSSAGLQTALFGLAVGNSVLAAGDSVGWFYSGGGSIAVDLNQGPGVNSGLYGGVALDINAPTFLPNRTYSVSFTADQVTLASPSAPAQGTVSDGCTNCLFKDTPVTSQYNGTTLQSWSFYALNTNPVYPVIFGPDGTVIGYGEAATPTAAGGLQTFAYVPVWGDAVLQTGDSLGWYFPQTGSIAFSLTGGQGASYAAFPVLSLGAGDYTTTALPGRDYAVGFTTSGAMAETPEPSYTVLIGLCFSMLVFFRPTARIV